MCLSIARKHQECGREFQGQVRVSTEIWNYEAAQKLDSFTMLISYQWIHYGTCSEGYLTEQGIGLGFTFWELLLLLKPFSLCDVSNVLLTHFFGLFHMALCFVGVWAYMRFPLFAAFRQSAVITCVFSLIVDVIVSLRLVREMWKIMPSVCWWHTVELLFVITLLVSYWFVLVAKLGTIASYLALAPST